MAKSWYEIEQNDENKKFFVRIFPHNDPTKKVVASLPEDFGFSVGSEVKEPFSQYLSDGPVSDIMAANFDVSAKAGLFTERHWMGPEQTDIELSLDFHSYYDAKSEVMKPIIKLMGWSVGRQKNLGDLNSSLMNKIRESFPEGEQNTDVEEMFKFFAGPDSTIDIKMGDVFTLKNTIISSASPSFSNVIDNQGFPISASIDLSVVVKIPFDKDRIVDGFHKIRMGGGV